MSAPWEPYDPVDPPHGAVLYGLRADQHSLRRNLLLKMVLASCLLAVAVMGVTSGTGRALWVIFGIAVILLYPAGVWSYVTESRKRFAITTKEVVLQGDRRCRVRIPVGSVNAVNVTVAGKAGKTCKTTLEVVRDDSQRRTMEIFAPTVVAEAAPDAVAAAIKRAQAESGSN